jgi:lysozyme
MPTPRQRKIAKATAAAIAIASPFEGIAYYAYRDPPGILTACRGHTGPDVKVGVKYTLAQCDAWMDADMRKAVEAVDRCHPNLPEPVLIAFADAAFNIGPKVACDAKSSTAARYLFAGRWNDACLQLPRWDKASIAGVMVALPGLTKRRNVEKDICMTWSQS